MIDHDDHLFNMRRDLALLMEVIHSKGLWWRTLEVADDKLALCLAIMDRDSSFDASKEDYDSIVAAWEMMGHGHSSGWWTYAPRPALTNPEG